MKDPNASKLHELLNGIISTTIAGPGGDPDRQHMQAAARAFIALKLLKLPIDGEEEYRLFLRNIPEIDPKDAAEDAADGFDTDTEEDGNIWKTDFLKEAGWPKSKDTIMDEE